QPRRATQGTSVKVSGGAAALGGFGGGGSRAAASRRKASPFSIAQTVRAWSPVILLTAIVTVWSVKPFKALFAAKGPLAGTILSLHVPGLDQLVVRTAPIVASPKPYEAVFKLDWLSAVGTAIMITAILSAILLRMKPRAAVAAFFETLGELRRPVLSIGLVLAFGML
ncbi:L-lactate permease, partial [Paraburkholderia sp. BR14261]